MEELEKAHEDYEARKERLIENLKTLKSNLSMDESIPKYWLEWLDIAVDFINEKEI